MPTTASSIAVATTSFTGSALTTAALHAIIPGLDGVVLFMAIAGALIFVIRQQEIPMWQRIVFSPICAAVGYISALEIMFPIIPPSIAALIISFLCITVLLKGAEFINKDKFERFLPGSSEDKTGD